MCTQSSETAAVEYVIRTVCNSHGGADLDAWLSACEMLRIPTADVAFNPKIEAATIEAANANPANFSASKKSQQDA